MKLDLNKTTLSDYDSLADHEIPTMITDGVSDQKETKWINNDWSKQWGYFNQNSELKNALLLKSIWNVGKGYNADSLNKTTLNMIRGFGKDSFKTILFNMDVVKRIGGDAYAEIIRADNKQKTIINLKPLDPGTIRIVVDNFGVIKRYEQVAKTGRSNRKAEQTFKPDEIFHLTHNRLADQIHGISDIDAVEKVILAEDRSFEDLEKITHFQAKPFMIFKLKTDNPTKISSFAGKIRSARDLGDDMFVPDDENLVSWEVVNINPSSILMQWRDDLRNKFYRTIGLPQIVPGGGGNSTESESKVIYLAFEQIVMSEQLDTEEQILNQLGIKLDLIHPTLIGDLIAQDEKKDATEAVNTQPSEFTPGENE